MHPDNVKRHYKEYRDQYLNELFDNPLQNIQKLDSGFKYIIYDNEQDVAAIVLFKFECNIPELPYFINKQKIGDHYFSISWEFKALNDKDWTDKQATENWVRVTATMFKVLDKFIRDKNPKLILFSPDARTKTDKVYFHFNFLDKLRILFGADFDIVPDITKGLKVAVYIIHKSISRARFRPITKLAEREHISYEEAERIGIEYRKKKNLKGISRNDHIKEQIKRIILKQIYLK